ncbi:tetratricopeptide repeat protein [Salidesulfovibrio onnuriiensis]|uniref:tetratricopeptide repeat protein n=1 Tax=Salidesulfovibrio onnuriiensis TaxID=2583823 RepID=UPI00165028EF|nr:tetratricopeptide repeat protein [Salidesulfovibrio onnuriiensis]
MREIKIGSGTTAKKQKSKILWYVEQTGEDDFQIKKVNSHFVPTGKAESITFDQLMQEYAPEVEIHLAKVGPAMRHLHDTLDKGDALRHEDELEGAEEQYTLALEVDEENVRAIFGLGIVYTELRKISHAQAVFKQLVNMEAAFQEEHKHLFNEFGISLRKGRMFNEAARYYARALEFCVDEDEHLYYNLARVFYEQGDWNKCFENLKAALEINDNLTPALGLCRLIDALYRDKALLTKYEKPPVPEGVGLEATRLYKALGGLPDSIVTTAGSNIIEKPDQDDT